MNNEQKKWNVAKPRGAVEARDLNFSLLQLRSDQHCSLDRPFAA